MIKQLASILLIFTVNILFLTHAVLPHHHHGEIPHFIFSKIENLHLHENTADDCCCTNDNCAENRRTKSGNCLFERELDVRPPSEDEDCHCLMCCALHDHPDLLLQAILFDFSSDSSLSDIEAGLTDRLTSPPYLITYNSVEVNQIHGLRSPPFVV